MISIKNPVISVLFLISVFINISGYLVLIGLSFLGISYLIVYVGAVTVLFLFVIIIFNLQVNDFTSGTFTFLCTDSDSNNSNKLLAIINIFAASFIYEVIFIFDSIQTSSLFSLDISVSFNQFNTFILYSFTPLLTPKPCNSFMSFHPYCINTIDSDMLFINFTDLESLGIVIYTNSVT